MPPREETLGDLYREVGLRPAALDPRNTARRKMVTPLPPSMRGLPGYAASNVSRMAEEDIGRGRALGMEPGRGNQVREAAGMLAETTGLPGALRANQAFSEGDTARGLGEAGMGLLNLAGTASMFAPMRNVPRAPVRAALAEAPTPPPTLSPTWERAADGSVLPVRPQSDRLFSRTAPTSADLRGAAATPPAINAPRAQPSLADLGRPGNALRDGGVGADMSGRYGKGMGGDFEIITNPTEEQLAALQQRAEQRWAANPRLHRWPMYYIEDRFGNIHVAHGADIIGDAEWRDVAPNGPQAVFWDRLAEQNPGIQLYGDELTQTGNYYRRGEPRSPGAGVTKAFGPAATAAAWRRGRTFEHGNREFRGVIGQDADGQWRYVGDFSASQPVVYKPRPNAPAPRGGSTGSTEISNADPLGGISARRLGNALRDGGVSVNASGRPRGIRGFHGSPYDFAPEPGHPLGRFRPDKIGTGEGAQAYGYGHYIAENESVSRVYRNRLADPVRINDTTRPDAIAQERFRPQWDALVAQRRLAAGPNLRGDTSAIDAQLDSLHQQMIADTHSRMNIAPNGRMYEVNIHADPEEFLDWDAPPSQQSPSVMRAFRRGLGVVPNYSPGSDYGLGVISKGDTGWNLYRAAASGRVGGERAVSETLADAGIPGIRYLDQGSRGVPPNQWRVSEPNSDTIAALFDNEAAARAFAAENGGTIRHITNPLSSNYVIFPGMEDIIEILRKYGIGGLGVGAAAGAGAQQNAPGS